MIVSATYPPMSSLTDGPKSQMDDFQLVIHPDDADKAKRMLAHRGIEFINF